MKKLIFIIAILHHVSGLSQGVFTRPADTMITESGDTMYLTPVTFHPVGQAEYYDGSGNLTETIALISPDTVLLTFYYNSGAVKAAYYNKLAVPIDTVTDFNPEWPGHFRVRNMTYCENGNVRTDHRLNDTTYEVYDCQGNLWVRADSINDYFMPLGAYTLLDTLTGQMLKRGEMITCPFNRFTCCEQGWWDFYENGILIARELFEDGWSKEKISYR
ncbi:hypothetical protein O3Q51_14340 [Cryomorphaceae bacterium 1068]|nr:hypothetical protein [Cryomorphaceae bacterium 1068]